MRDEEFYKSIVNNSPLGYAYHRIIKDEKKLYRL